MHGNLISFIFLSILISINGQYEDERDLPPAPYHSHRASKTTFDTQFPSGRCPERFYQSNQECLYFSTDGKIYSWNEAKRICSGRVARMLNKHSQSDMSQPNMSPTRGVRQLVLNTPEKTEIFRALFREYNEQNFAIRLPSDYNTLGRCYDGNDDKWPQFCTNGPYSNTTCFETVSNSPNDICLREVDCRQRYLRVACEFTLPGSSEITNSTFRTCSKRRAFFRRLPLWAWILIALGSALLLICVIAVLIVFIRKSKQNKSSNKRALPEPRETTTRVTTKRDDPAKEPMLVRPPPPPITDSGYLQPRSTASDNTANA